MATTTLREQVNNMIDRLPADALPELVEFVDFLRFKTERAALAPQVREAIRLYTAGEVSLGRAAEIAGMNYFVFEELLREQGVPVVVAEAADKEERVDQEELVSEILA